MKVSQYSRIFSYLFLLSIISLEISFGLSGRKIGTALIIFTSLLVAVRLLGSAKKKLITTITLSDFAFLALTLYIGASSFWSLNPTETISHFFLWMLVWFVIKALSEVHVKSIVHYIIWISVIVSLLSFLIIPLFPNAAYQPKPSSSFPELRGIFHHQLRFGLFASLSLGLLILLKLNNEREKLLRNNYIYYFCFFVLAAAMIMSFARLYVFFGFLSFLMVYVISFSTWKRRLYLSVIFFTVGLIIVMDEAILSWLVGHGIDVTLTGRVRIWGISIEMAEKNWLLGTGFSSFHNSIFDSAWGIYRPAHPHNSFIQAYFELGVIGLGLGAFLVMCHYKNVVNINTVNARSYSYSVFVYFLAFFGSLVGSNYIYKPTVILCVLFFLLETERRNKKIIKR